MLCNLAYVKNESRSAALTPLIDAVNRETCKVHNLLRPFGVSNYHLFVISSAKKSEHFPVLQLPPCSLIRDFGKQRLKIFPSILHVIDRSDRNPPITAS